MGENKKPNLALKLVHELTSNPELQYKQVPSEGLKPNLARLREWQSQRLENTYADMLEDKRFMSACRFFLTDIYAPKDFTQRDEDVQRIYRFLSKIMPPPTIQLLTEAVELTRLTYVLDESLLAVLEEMGSAERITPKAYAEGYRRCDNYDLRLEQIARITHLLKVIANGSKLPMVGTVVRLAKKPAMSAGYDELYSFVTRGYSAFRSMRSPQIFVHTIEKREKQILDRIYASDPEPFDVI